MPTPTYVALATTTLSGGETSVTFSSIPATYRDIIMVIAGGMNVTQSLEIYFNSDTAANYSQVNMIGSSSGAESTTSAKMFDIVYNSGSVGITQIMDYSATDKHKTVLFRNGSASSSELYASAGRWASTSAINTILLEDNTGGSFDADTTISLYGIAS